MERTEHGIVESHIMCFEMEVKIKVTHVSVKARASKALVLEGVLRHRNQSCPYCRQTHGHFNTSAVSSVGE